MQALSCPLSPQLPLTTCALAEGHLPLPPAFALLSDMAQTLSSQSQAWLGWPRSAPFFKAERRYPGLVSLPPYSALASSKPTLAGGLKCIYFLDLFFNKKEKEHKVSLWRLCRNTAAGLFQEPEGWGVQRSWHVLLRAEPREAQPRNTG